MADKKVLNQAAIDAAIAAKIAANQRVATAQTTASQSAVAAAKALTAKLNAANQSLQASKGAALNIPSALASTATSTSQQAYSDIAAYNQAQQYAAGINIPAPVYSTTTSTSDAQSAYDTLYNEFKQYGLESLIEPLKGMIEEGATGAQLTLALQNTDAYKKRFAANQQRINAGLRALSPAEYISLEDQYQNLMRNYGLPNTYWTKGDLGIQEGFNKLIAGDVSATELESRLIEAQQKVNNANPEVKQALKQFYPGITDGDILAYSLDPKNALTDIKRKVAAAEIGGAQLAAGLAATVTNAEGLAAAGVTGQKYQQAAYDIANAATRGSQLSGFYGLGPYTQQTAEQAILDVPGSVEALKKTKKLTELEKASFSGQSGTSQGALSRDRALTNYMLGTPGAGAF